MKESMGSGAVKKMAKRRMEAISGNYSSYARVMNNKEHLQMAVEVNEVSLALGELRQETENEKKAAAKQRKVDEMQREQRKQQAASLESKKKEDLRPSLLTKADQLASRALSVADIPNRGLVELLRYFFEPPLEGLSKLKRPQLVEAVEDRLNTFREQRFEA